MKQRDLVNLLNRAAAALETPADLTPDDHQQLVQDLIAEAAFAGAATIFAFIVDPAHSWLRVTRAQIAAVSLKPEDFSRYSYRGFKDDFYLEEDCDAPKFLAAWEKIHGKPQFTELHTNRSSLVRKLPPIHD